MKANSTHPADELVYYMSRIYEMNLTTTSGGNLSIKDDKGDIYITPGGYDKGSLKREDIVCIHPDGTMEGIHKPSSELAFHKKIYEANPDFHGILHAHSPALIAFSVVRKIPDTDLFPSLYQKCGKITMARYALTGSDELGDIIAKEFEKGCDITILENHGLVAGGTTLEDAYLKFEALEFGAEIQRFGQMSGSLKHLSHQELSPKPDSYPLAASDCFPFLEGERGFRDEICQFMHRAYKQKLTCGAFGSASIRLEEDDFIMTPKGLDRSKLTPKQLVRICKGQAEEGKSPDEYAPLHQAIYQQHPEIHSIFIAQPQSLMAFAITDAPMNTRLIPESYMVLQDIKKVPFKDSRDPKKLADSMALDETLLLLENDAALAVGPNILRAFDRLEVAEYSAKAIISAQSLGPIVEIGPKEIQDLRDKFHIR